MEFERYKYESFKRFNKKREIFPSITRVLSILQTTSAISASVEKTNFKGRITSDRKPKVFGLSPAVSYEQSESGREELKKSPSPAAL